MVDHVRDLALAKSDLRKPACSAEVLADGVAHTFENRSCTLIFAQREIPFAKAREEVGVVVGPLF